MKPSGLSYLQQAGREAKGQQPFHLLLLGCTWKFCPQESSAEAVIKGIPVNAQLESTFNTHSRSGCTDTKRVPLTKPDELPYKDLSRSAHRFPSRFGVKQDHGDPFGLSMVRAVVFHPGRYERAWGGQSRKGRDYFRRNSEVEKKNIEGEKIHQSTRLALVVSMGTTPFTKVAPHSVSQVRFSTWVNMLECGSRAHPVSTHASPAQTGSLPWCDGWRSCVRAGSPSSSSSETPPPTACSQNGSSSVGSHKKKKMWIQ